MAVETRASVGMVFAPGMDFEREVVASEMPVLVDFWAPWCGPCVAVAPVLEELAQELADKVRLVQVNVEEHPELAERFGISSIPAFLLFQGGEVTGRMLGAMPKQVYRKFLGQHL
jgi:thioredoxin 1